MSTSNLSVGAESETALTLKPSYTTIFNGEDGAFLTISPEGFTDGETTIDIGDAARLFSEWCRTWIPQNMRAEDMALVDRQAAEIERLETVEKQAAIWLSKLLINSQMTMDDQMDVMKKVFGEKS